MMRLLSTFDRPEQAGICLDVLTSRGIEASLRDGDGDLTEVWVRQEDDLPVAETVLQEFLQQPASEEFQQARQTARRIRQKEQQKRREPAPVIDARTAVFHSEPVPRGAVSLLLVALCVMVFLFSGFGRDLTKLARLFIIDVTREAPGVDWRILWHYLQAGEVWRLFTPVLIHFDFMHILFNMMWLLDLGGLVEHRKGSVFFLVFVLSVGVLSNLAQFVWSHPVFGGMSGVNYGLVGFIWMKGRFDPQSGLGLHRTVIITMVIWYVVCLLGLVGHVANGAHTAGLAVGILWGILNSPGAVRRLVEIIK
jgi:GlpG protein